MTRRFAERSPRELGSARLGSGTATCRLSRGILERLRSGGMRTHTGRTIALAAAAAMLTAGLALAQERGGAPGGGGGRGGGRGPATPPLIMTSTAWEDGGVIPDKYTQAAGATAPSPELKWSQVPMGTQSFVLLMHDPEPVLQKGSKMDITHWLVWNIPGTSTGLPEGVM